MTPGEIYMVQIPGQSPSQRGEKRDLVQCLEYLGEADGARVWRLVYELSREDYQALFGGIRATEYDAPVRVQQAREDG